MKQNKGIIGIGLLVAIVLGVVVIGGGAYYLGKSNNKLEVKSPENILPNNENKELPVVENQKTSQVATGCDSSSKPSIKIISPNGGEVFSLGQTINIKWSSKCIDSNALVYLNIGIKDSQAVSELLDGKKITNNGSYNFTIPSNYNVGGNKSNKYEVAINYIYGNGESVGDHSDNSFTINSGVEKVDLSTFSTKYIRPTKPWPPTLQHSTIQYSCSTISRDVFDTPTLLTGKQKSINGKIFCIYSYSDVGAGHAAGVYTYITAGLNGSGTKRVDFRLDWPNGCGAYDQEYDQCKNDQSTFFNNLDAYIASLM